MCVIAGLVFTPQTRNFSFEHLFHATEVASEAACLVDPSSPESIRDGILRIINNEYYRQELVEAGYENVKRFRPEVIALEYVKLYKMLNH